MTRLDKYQYSFDSFLTQTHLEFLSKRPLLPLNLSVLLQIIYV